MGLPFMKSRARKRDQIIAIDLGGRSSKAVHLQRKGDRFLLLNYAIVDAASHDKAISPEVLTEHLKEIGRVLDVRARPITLALGVNDTVFKQAEVPLMSPADLRQMLKYSTKNYLQQELQDYVFDCHYLMSGAQLKLAEGSKPGVGAAQKQKAIIGGAKRQTIEDVNSAIKAAGFLPDQIIPSLTGPVNAFELAEPEVFAGEVVALVEIGFKGSTIIILGSGEIMLNRVVAIGGDHFTQGLADQLGTSYQEAENIKIGLPAEVQQNLEPLIQPLGRELRASIDFFEHQQDKTVSKVYIAGGSARSEFIVQSLQGELMVPCQAWSPLKFLQLGLPPERMGDIEQVAPQLSVAIGAATVSF
ncbi:MAG: type pilus assembly protein PilM [Verrucomicrobiota bacterium]|jgi:type IV pilus assembly protein PilM